MRLNGLGAPDETTLVPLNLVEVAPRKQRKSQINEEIVSIVAKIWPLQSAMSQVEEKQVL